MYMWRDKQHRRAHTWHACLWLLYHTLPSSVSKSWQLSSTTCSLCYVATRSVLPVLVCYYNASGRKSECLHSYTHTVSSIGIHLLALSLEPVVATAIYFYGYIVRWLHLARSMQYVRPTEPCSYSLLLSYNTSAVLSNLPRWQTDPKCEMHCSQDRSPDA